MEKDLSLIKDVPTQVKDPELVKRRRRQIVDAAVELFIKKGFHKTTTREIAQRAGLSIGSVYEYVSTKEDVLYLVCDVIHAEAERQISEALARTKGGRETIAEVIREYFMVCHRMSDHILLVYQETQSLPSRWRKKVLANEVRFTGIFKGVLERLVAAGELPALEGRILDLLAHNITVLGHMWTFRRWFLSRQYSIEEYITIQTALICGDLFGQRYDGERDEG
ncbi:MAG: TetR/AcrR family transcriptional regulator [Deltaproteobacteria bacterium]|jgi:AcrR family transcriptional regulator|nr:TetR/AcrR family transcriptional regulator [Deltaproteobacteria bacterium]